MAKVIHMFAKEQSLPSCPFVAAKHGLAAAKAWIARSSDSVQGNANTRARAPGEGKGEVWFTFLLVSVLVI